MPSGVRSSLVLVAILSGLSAAHAASEAGPGAASTWTDPPSRPPEASKPAARASQPSTPAAASAAQTSTRKSRTAARRETASTRRQAARQTRTHVAHETPPRHVPAARPVQRYAGPIYGYGYAYGRPTPAWRAYPRYTEAGFPPSYEDQRLDRLSTAVGSGYLVMHRRSVEYPDGRVIRYYRPYDEE